MTSILDLHNPWRDALLPASFRNAHFHCEAGSVDNGRRIALHEFPKKELPYAEDLGRRAKTFTVRGYCITYPYNMGGQGAELYNTDYRIARNMLRAALEVSGPGILQLPTLPAENVVVDRYRLSEEEKVGGYCVFDIQFTEFGVPPQFMVGSNTGAALSGAADQTMNIATDGMNGALEGSTPVGQGGIGHA